MSQRTNHPMRSSTSLRFLAFSLSVAAAFGPLVLAADAVAETPAPAAPPAQAEKTANQVIRELVDQAFATLRDPVLKTQPEQRVKKLREITDKVMDWDSMAKSSLGHHWRNLSEQERADFVSVFKELLARQYRDDVDRFRGNESVVFGEDEKREGLVTVKTTLTTASGEKVPINYTLHQVGNKWLVEDVSVEGVSMTNHYRKTFDRYLVNDPFATLLGKLKKKLGWQ
jgi:phospholipid transport system substrate-binding protein